ncbi:histidine kinase [Sphingobacterium sp. WM]|uniref:sensor histidine kinase n=1 Tax=Sphingobacterium sp. WM TaxID=3031802 RepID=UPI00240DBD4B|nr:ATP-binding protein [Sphingobacterium sp. WM]WFB64909.1 histidine kinase [Sphingobacterium sp. WM]
MLTSTKDKSNNKSDSGRQFTLLQEDCNSDLLCFDVFFKEGPFAIIVLDKNFHVKRVNGRSDYIFGLGGKDLLKRDIFEFLNTEDAYQLKGIFENRDTSAKPLLISLGFKNKKEPFLRIETFVKKFSNRFHEPLYCLLLFDKQFYPHHHWVELKKEIFQAIVDTQEQERFRIGTQLHDSVAQTLYAIKLNLRQLEGERKEKSKEIESIKLMLNEAISQIRNISIDLVPVVLHDFGLKAAIQFMVNRIESPDFQVSIVITKKVEEYDEDIRLVIYRIIQELLNNCLKHSQASKVAVKVGMVKDKIQIIVKDNGVGFNEDLNKQMKKGIGLRSIKNRIDLYQGEMEIISLKKGSAVSITLNLV